MEIVIGDIHGCYKSFRKLLEEIINVSKDDHIYLLGDYIDRGPSSKQVLDYMLDLKEKGYQLFPLRGNHEEMLVNAYLDQSSNNFMLWMMNGADTTFQSYGIKSYSVMGEASLNELPEEHLSFIRQMPYYYKLEKYIIVHAGVNFESNKPFEDFRSMVWCRDCENDLSASGGRAIIHGHTPVPLDFIKSSLDQGIQKDVNLDAGCVYKEMLGMGNLAALDLTSKTLYSTENVDF
jgi:serine/threonine protein phosphatase 1